MFVIIFSLFIKRELMNKINLLVITIVLAFTMNGNMAFAGNPDFVNGSKKFSLDDLQYRTFRYFWDLADSVSGLIPDRAPTKSFSSIAATGFGLTSYIVGVQRNYITREQAAARVLRTLNFLANLPQSADETGVAGYKGFFYHFLDMRSGLRHKNVELSSMDTGLLMAGILSCLSYFDQANESETAIRTQAEFLYRRVEWDWMITKTGKMCMGWDPETGFINATWDGYNEAMVLLIMAIGSPTYPINASTWEVWCKTYKWEKFQGQEIVNFGPLFGHQYSQMYIDFKGIYDHYMKDKGIDYFENSRRATIAQQAYCTENPGKWEGYSDKTWGLSACDGPGHLETLRKGKKVVYEGYNARGVAAGYTVDDGTITPAAAGGSIPFVPGICIPALQNMYMVYGKKLYGTYGFKDSFNPSYRESPEKSTGWFNADYIGIDQGPIVIQIENNRTRLVWNIMQNNPYIVQGLKLAGFTGGWIDTK
jgi:hypothetical protein